jgi:hypothetical protein
MKSQAIKLYVEDVLGDRVMSKGGASEGQKRGGERTGDEGRV